MSYVIAIPTYNRPEQVSGKTLTTLLNGGINKNKIYIFVANKRQEKMYEEIIPKNMYKEIVVGKLGITNQRKFISKYFPEGQYIISMDDDIEELLSLRGTRDLIKINDLETFFIDAYKLLKKENSGHNSNRSHSLLYNLWYCKPSILDVQHQTQRFFRF